MRTLGIDFGERRIGLAISDPAGRLAVPLTAIERQTDRRAAYRIADLVESEAVEALVFGEPKDLQGRSGANVERVHRFAERLGRITGLPVRWIDETLTTVEATERLRQAGLDRRDAPQRRDSVAAQIILQEALDRGAAVVSGDLS